MRIFIGIDPRQPIAWVVLANSIARHSSIPVEITPLVLNQLPLKRRGLTEFTYSRFLVPYLCKFQGRALFLDADMVVTGDIAEMVHGGDLASSVCVNQEQAKFEWSSALLYNCYNCQMLTPDYVENKANVMFDLAWADHGVSTFDPDWNTLCGYGETRTNAKLYHFSKGIPIWPETSGENGTPQDHIWMKEVKIACSSVSYQALMGASVHALPKKAAS